MADHLPVQAGFIDAVVESTSRAFHELRSRFRGALIQPGEEAYAEPAGSGTALSIAGRR